MKGAKFSVFVIIILMILYTILQLDGYLAYRELLPPGTTISGLAVGGLTHQEARAIVEQAYDAPVTLYYGNDTIRLHPQRVEFRLKQSTVWADLERQMRSASFLKGFGTYLLGDDLPPLHVEIDGRLNEQKLGQLLADIAKEYDRGMLPPQAKMETLTFSRGQSARWLNIEASIPLVIAALNSASDREATLIYEQGAPPPGSDISLLRQMIEWRVEEFNGIVSVFAKNMETGEELVIGGDVAYAGMSILKIPIMIETYRWLSGEPDQETAKLLRETMITSGNFTANLLLRQIGYRQRGEDSAFAGVDELNETLSRLGMVNTFMATPYDTEELPRRFVTPANSRTDLTTYPDPYMQTTALDAGMVLEMIYQLSKGGGTLMVAFPGAFTAEEGQAMIDLMAQNHEAILLEGGLPDDAQLAHKHGYVEDTHANAAIVLTPEGDFVLVVFIYYREGWLGELSFPIFADIATATYNYFNIDNPYLRPDRAAE
ncbi:MAG: serine hydrolase [Anaerolineae bacterium]|nr:serine hydrolase [Anaerolineae bacterium]